MITFRLTGNQTIDIQIDLVCEKYSTDLHKGNADSIYVYLSGFCGRAREVLQRELLQIQSAHAVSFQWDYGTDTKTPLAIPCSCIVAMTYDSKLPHGKNQ